MSDTAPHAPIPVQINFMSMRQPADIGVRRASVFLGLATNAAAAEPPLSQLMLVEAIGFCLPMPPIDPSSPSPMPPTVTARSHPAGVG